MPFDLEADWPQVTVAEALQKPRGRDLIKLQTGDYQITGKVPIVDQGVELVCGYTDDEGAAYPYPLPVIIFGDHTRELKYVDFPFAIGADGTQCLHPTTGIDPRFFYYSLVALKLPSEGYARHFKLLKERRIPVPPLDEQRRIAEVLWSVDEAIAASAAVLAAAEETVWKLAATIRDPLADTLTLADFGEIVTGRTPSPAAEELWRGDLPFITPGDLSDGMIGVSDAARHLNGSAEHGAKLVPPGSVLVTCIGSTIGKTALARTSCATNQQINAICCPLETAGFVYLVCLSLRGQILARAGRQAVPIINKSTFSRLLVPKHDRQTMVNLSRCVDQLDAQITAARIALRSLSEVKARIVTSLLSGRVRVPA